MQIKSGPIKYTTNARSVRIDNPDSWKPCCKARNVHVAFAVDYMFEFIALAYHELLFLAGEHAAWLLQHKSMIGSMWRTAPLVCAHAPNKAGAILCSHLPGWLKRGSCQAASLRWTSLIYHRPLFMLLPCCYIYVCALILFSVLSRLCGWLYYSVSGVSWTQIFPETALCSH